MKPEPVGAGSAVKLARDVKFAGHIFATGELAVVQAVYSCPPGIVDGDLIYDACVIEGAYRDGAPAFSIPVPFAAADLVVATPAPATQGGGE